VVGMKRHGDSNRTESTTNGGNDGMVALAAWRKKTSHHMYRGSKLYRHVSLVGIAVSRKKGNINQNGKTGWYCGRL